MPWMGALRQLAGISERWGTISERIGFGAQEDLLRLLVEALASSGTALLELINRMMQIGLNSGARDIFREIGRASRKIPETERGAERGDASTLPPKVPPSLAAPPAPAAKAA